MLRAGEVRGVLHFAPPPPPVAIEVEGPVWPKGERITEADLALIEARSHGTAVSVLHALVCEVRRLRDVITLAQDAVDAERVSKILELEADAIRREGANGAP
jgi:hypothetical protein